MTATLAVSIPSYRLVPDLVAEGRAWFGSKGSPTLELRLEVVD